MPRVSVDGVDLHVTELGQGSPLVLLHGFTGSGADWSPLAEVLADERRCVLIDLLGHGGSDAPEDAKRYRMPHCVSDLAAVFDRLGIECADLIGYSMGGRVALALALARPERVGTLILEGASPGIADARQRASRREQDEKWADLIDREGIETFADAWMGQPLFASQARLDAATLAEVSRRRRANSPVGLANSLRGLGTGSQESFWERLPELTIPTLLIAGTEDEKFRNIAADMAARISHAEICVVPEAGHTTHLENPVAFESVVRSFLRETARIPSPASQGRGLAPPGAGNLEHPKEVQTMSIEWLSKRSYTDVLYETAEGIAKITINRPDVRNAFRPQTTFELMDAFAAARDDREVGVVILTGAGTEAFCSGGDQRVRGEAGYVGDDGVPRLNVLDLQRQIRTLPKPVVAMVAGYAIGGGHVLHLVCDLTIAAENAVFGQTGPRVGSFDGGYGATYMARIIGHKKAREVWFLCRKYDAAQALDMGLVNAVVPVERLEEETVEWCREILGNSPMALRCLKAAFNADTDGLAGIQELAGNATLLFYMSEEAQEGRNAFLEKRPPDYSRFPRLP